MSLFFLLLKIVGILVASVGALLKFAKEDTTVDKKHRISRWFPKRLRGDNVRKHELSLVMLGMILSVLSIGIEQYINNKKAEESHIVTTQQIAQAETNISLASKSLAELRLQNLYAQATLDSIQKLLTRFEDIELVAVFSFPADDFKLDKLLEKDVQFKKQILDEEKRLNSGTNADENGGHNGQNIVGYGNVPDSPFMLPLETIQEGTNEVISLTLDELSSFQLTSVHPFESNPSDNLSQDNVASLDIAKSSRKMATVKNDLVNFLRTGNMTIRISKINLAMNPDIEGDFNAKIANYKSLKIEYLYPLNRIRVTWIIDCLPSTWKRNSKMASLPDLGGAYISVKLEGYKQASQSILNHRYSPDNEYPLQLKVIVNAIPIEPHILFDFSDNNFHGLYAIFPSNAEFLPVIVPPH